MAELKALATTITTEQRAFTDDESAKIKELQKAISDIDSTIKTANEIAGSFEAPKDPNEDPASGKGDPAGAPGAEGAEPRAAVETRSEADIKQMADLIRGAITEQRAGEMTFTDNGAVIPQTISKNIIKKVYDICPILEKATKYNAKGTLELPFYDASASDITMAYADEFKELASSNGKFTTIELKGFLAGVLSLVSVSLVNNTDINLVNFVEDHMAEQVARFVEHELLFGTAGKADGLTGVTLSQKTAATSAITADELIDTQAQVKDIYQKNAIWIMSPKTRTALRKLKDGEGRYMMQPDVTQGFGTVLLGKPVYVSDAMLDMEAGKTAIYYGDMSGLAVKMVENFTAQVLREKYATMHAIGVVGWMEFDSKVENAQKIAKLVMAAAPEQTPPADNGGETTTPPAEGGQTTDTEGK